MVGPLIFFQAREDCDQARIANGTSPLLSHHKMKTSSSYQQTKEEPLLNLTKKITSEGAMNIAPVDHTTNERKIQPAALCQK